MNNQQICKDDNSLKWIFSNIALYHALQKSDKLGKEKYGSYPPLSNGSYGFVFGYDNNYVNHHFNGIYKYGFSVEKDASFSVENYKIIEKCQHFVPLKWNKTNKAMCDAILQKSANEENEQVIELINNNFISCKDGILYANFPVFDSNLFNTTIKEMLKLKDKVGQLTHIHHQMDAMAFIIETMVEKGQLTVPEEKVNLCIFGVRNNK